MPREPHDETIRERSVRAIVYAFNMWIAAGRVPPDVAIQTLGLLGIAERWMILFDNFDPLTMEHAGEALALMSGPAPAAWPSVAEYYAALKAASVQHIEDGIDEVSTEAYAERIVNRVRV